MARIGLAAVGVLVVIGAVMLSAPTSDVPVPDWMRSRVEDGRATLLERGDLLEPGSPVVFIGAHCRDDGAVRLLYTVRWWWVVEHHLYSDASSDWAPGSMSGGMRSPDDDPRSDDGWIVGHEEVDCATRPG